MMFNVGDTIRHKLFGDGKVLELQNRGFYLVVKYEKNQKLGVVRSDEVIKVAPVSGATSLLDKNEPLGAAKSIVVPVIDDYDTKSRSMIETFRLGVVPYGAVRDFTFGREKEIGIINKWLNSNSEGALIVSSGYGSGKSHLLDYINILAVENDYAVVSAEFDLETPPYQPKKIYEEFVKSFRLRGNDGELSFRDFIKEISNRQSGTSSAGGYINRAANMIKQCAGDEYLLESIWDWIEGRKTSVRIGYYNYTPMLYDSGTASNIYCHIISEIAYRVFYNLKMNGIVVVLDEAERVKNWTDIQNTKGWYFVRGLTMLAANDRRLESERIILNKSPTGSYFGEETGLVYHGFEQNLRYYDHLPSYVKVVFAFTEGKYDIENLLDEWEIPHIPLKLDILPDSAFGEIFHKIYELYNSSYKFTLPDTILQRSYTVVKLKTKNQNAVIRNFIKATIELFDILRFNPELSPEEIE